MHVYEKAFLSRDYGVGQAEALVLFLLVAAITLLQVYFSKKLEVEA
jgi:raffinose/stachyose/melibiose transport system permease protein